MSLFAAVDAAAVVTAIGTLVLALVTIMYVMLTRQLVRIQTEPCIVVYAQSRPDLESRALIEIVIENVGNSVARDIRFTTSDEIHCRFLSIDGTEVMARGPLIDGIPALGPKQKRVILWDLYDEIRKRLGDRSIRVTARFNLAGSFPMSCCAKSVESILEVASLADNELRFDDGTWHCAQYLKEIRDALNQRMSNLPGQPPPAGCGGEMVNK